jgi:DNA-binding response OmpR family regulator
VPPTGPPAAALRINLEKANVLLVESTTQGMDILSQIFAGFGARSPLRATTAADAMKAAHGAPLDLIVCDPALPDEDGYDFMRQLRRARLEPNSFAPAILTTAHTPKSQILKARDCGANFVVVKPLSPRVMLDRIMWIARENRAFIECDSYVGPDRRFQSLGPPAGTDGRRKDDLPAEVGAAVDPNMSQSEIDDLMKPRRVR